eukprot:m.260024 g.260024  ORF g.260024 m.260024 type:complete len:102 (+) comp37916_c0_seq1:200-505(+)
MKKTILFRLHLLLLSSPTTWLALSSFVILSDNPSHFSPRTFFSETSCFVFSKQLDAVGFLFFFPASLCVFLVFSGGVQHLFVFFLSEIIHLTSGSTSFVHQ